jgi:hypothetical protein
MDSQDGITAFKSRVATHELLPSCGIEVVSSILVTEKIWQRHQIAKFNQMDGHQHPLDHSRVNEIYKLSQK